jgi:hypothetical protein
MIAILNLGSRTQHKVGNYHNPYPISFYCLRLTLIHNIVEYKISNYARIQVLEEKGG